MLFMIVFVMLIHIVMSQGAGPSPIPIDIFLQDTSNNHPRGDAYLAQAKRLQKERDDMEKLIADAKKSVEKMEAQRAKRNQRAREIYAKQGGF